MEKRQVINFVNFIRGSEPRCETDLITPVKEQIRLLQQYGFKGTFLLQYDALCNPVFTDLLKDLPREQFEIGIWFEMVQSQAEKAGIAWKGRYSWDWSADCGFSVGYTPAQRTALVDVFFQKFYSVFGYYPKSFGSWAFDAITLEYANRTYGLDAACNCKDQWGTDGYTLWGGYYGQAYYPSRKNAFVPAQQRSNQISVPVFRMLGSDPVLQYDFGYLRNGTAAGIGHQGVITLEPVYNNQYGGGGVKQWVDWYLKENFNGCCLHFGYAQAGQENSFGWEAMKDGLEDQFAKIKTLTEQGSLEVETMGETGRWYQSQFAQTPPNVIATWDDWKGEGRKSVWYNCKNYRINLYGENGKFWIRDCYLFREDYAERYLTEACTGNKLEYDALPVIDGIRFCGDGVRSGIYPSTEAGSGERGMTFEKMHYREQGETAIVTFTGTPCGDITWRLSPEEITVSKTTDIPFCMNPVFAEFTKQFLTAEVDGENGLNLNFRDFLYKIELTNGKFTEKCTAMMDENEMKVRFF